MRRVDITGNIYGRLTVLGYDKSINGHPYWMCRCNCGNTISVAGEHLRRGLTNSCGCLRKEKSSERMSKAKRTHGLANTTLYRKFCSMKRRCYSEDDKYYPLYGARGIKIYDEWLHDFSKFYEWSIKNGYKPGLSIDRIDNNDGYYPWNCRYVELKKQQNNRRNNRILIYDGRSMCVNDWMRETGIASNVILARLRMGWSVEDTLTRPVAHKNLNTKEKKDHE